MANFEGRKALNFLGFLATVFIAAAILIAAIVGWVESGQFNITLAGLTMTNFTSALVCIANIFAYILAIVAGFCYAKSKRNVAFLIIQIIATLIIIFVMLTSLFSS